MTGPTNLHASTVAVGASGLLIVGPSGSGKTSLAWALMALGARLVADDRTIVSRPDAGPPVATAPDALSGLIEARGVGLIRVDTVALIRLRAAVDLGVVETERLPERHETRVLDYPLRLFHKVERAYFAPALLHYLTSEIDVP